jgi:hypothetical protein
MPHELVARVLAEMAAARAAIGASYQRLWPARETSTQGESETGGAPRSRPSAGAEGDPGADAD